MRSLAKKIPGVVYIYNQILARQARRVQVDSDSISQQIQRSLYLEYSTAFKNGYAPLENINLAGFRCYSQFEEDGILLYLLAAVGTKTRKVVELCCGPGSECMAANLIINHGFEGYLFDGNPLNVKVAKDFFASRKDCFLVPPKVSQAWITRDNVNDLIKDAGAMGEVDVLSLDMDGNDYHIWEAISCIQPRICVFETQDIIPAHLSLTIPYQPDFSCWTKPKNEWDFRSASLLAMQKLSKRKGYRLVGGSRYGFNAFFVREDLVSDLLPEIAVETILDNPWSQEGQKTRWPVVKDMGWLEV